MHGLSAADGERLEAHGIGVQRALRQLERLRNGPRKTKLDRPARLGDGILPLPTGREAERYAREGRAAVREGEVTRFVPASGAATRLFADLRAGADSGGALAEPMRSRFEEARPLLPFDGGPDELLQRYGSAPKALIPFHAYLGGERRTALEEQLVEAAAVARGGTVSVEFTVSGPHRPAFEALLALRLPALERRLGCRFRVSLSPQSPATDSLAVDARGEPFRTDDDTAAPLLLRPAGHGALLTNLQALADRGAELIALKNIDNLQPEPNQGAAVLVMLTLIGMTRELARSSGRPARICGMVPEVRTVGGGPFWVCEASGEMRLQIVETAQIDLEDGEQVKILGASTHMNPVFMVCAPRPPAGPAYRLGDYVDRDAWMAVHKSHDGRPLVAFERPGLWNGSMAGWKTCFVEVPREVYTPVKTIWDLCDTAHQANSGPLAAPREDS